MNQGRCWKEPTRAHSCCYFPVSWWTYWLRGKDLNLRPLGYEPNELPGCSTPHLDHNSAYTNGSNPFLLNKFASSLDIAPRYISHQKFEFPNWTLQRYEHSEFVWPITLLKHWGKTGQAMSWPISTYVFMDSETSIKSLIRKSSRLSFSQNGGSSAAA